MPVSNPRGARAPLMVGAGLIAAGICALSPPAAAFCRATTCDPRRGDVCERDASGCVMNFPQLHWPQACVSFSVHQDGSVKDGIDASELERSVHAAFSTWTRADCGGAPPSLTLQSLGQVACAAAEYDARAANANIFMFRDSEWSHDELGADALGVTTAHFTIATGDLLDVDVELNGTQGDITNSDPEDGADLLSILTHESGHFLGLDHTRDVSAVMYPKYEPGGPDLRSLSRDDTSAICAAYPPERSAATANGCYPVNGFSALCASEQRSPSGCAYAPSRPRDASAALGLLALSAVARRRSRRQ